MSSKVDSSKPEDSILSITLDIEGRLFKTTDTTIKSIPSSLLSSLNKDSKYFDSATNTFCFDRDSALFPHILAAHRDGEIHVPQHLCAIQFKKELQFWRIPETLIAPCCWSYYYSTHEALATLRKIAQTLPKATALSSIRLLNNCKTVKENRTVLLTEGPDQQESSSKQSWRQKLWLFLDEPRSSTAAKIWCFTFVIVAILSVVLNIICLEENVRVDPYLTPFEYYGNVTFNDKIYRLLMTDPHKVVLGLDCFCTAFFVTELCLHFVSCPNKRRYFYDWFYVTKAFLSFCMAFSLIFEFRKDWLRNGETVIIWFIVKSMNTLRVTLIFKIYKISGILNVLFLALTNPLKELCLLLFVLFLVVIMFGGLIFAFEIDTDMFPDITKSVWWALITMTTIGYGDLHPTQLSGYIVGSCCALVGVMTVALPIAVISSHFSTYKDRSDYLMKHLDAVRREESERGHCESLHCRL